MKKRLLFTLFLSLSLVPVLPESGFCRSPEESLKAQLMELAQLAEKAGYQISEETTHVDAMGNEVEETYEFALNADTEYQIVGVCDDDCEDLDLILRDEKGNIIARDADKDSTPVVEVTPKWTGKFKLSVQMASCKDAPCGYAFTILSK